MLTLTLNDEYLEVLHTSYNPTNKLSLIVSSNWVRGIHFSRYQSKYLLMLIKLADVSRWNSAIPGLPRMIRMWAVT